MKDVNDAANDIDFNTFNLRSEMEWGDSYAVE